MGGQTPNNIALPLHRLNVKVLGTSPEMIDTAENRFKFSRMLDRIEVDQPDWKELTSVDEAEAFAEKVSYPVLVRPSYVLSGAAMNTVYSKDDLANYLQQAAEVSREYPVVITKYIENAKEIEMDAVAKDGKMIMHFISEHVENAGVHSGDATLILPPQDLDPETVRRIEDATRKIGNALNVTGPYNIQFIAKDNEIKVIECNVRASRSFPFVSKVMGVDLIEMATKAIIGAHVDPYPPVNIPENYVGVKVPQFSFSRLSGADPILGVEMASTGEVASFGRDKYEAYLKALLSTGFQLPKKNVLLSIGGYKEKVEMLPSMKKLHELGYKLFATTGTADFLEANNIPVKFLEVFGEGEEGKNEQKSEYSLTQHLENNLIDLFINLPSANRFRRPANYVSRGYRSRRLAVDFQTPLVTNVKCAKLLIEAMVRNFDLEICNVDYKTSHETVVLPGLINIAAFVPGLAKSGSRDFEKVMKASSAAGFSMVRVLPLGLENSLTDARALHVAQLNTRRAAHCDYNFSVVATSTNSQQLSALMSDVGSLFIPFNHLSGNISKVAAVTSHFEVWPSKRAMVTDAKTTDLASILLLASLHGRKLHVTSVTTKDDIKLIALSKEKGLQVTCDVAIYSLFLSQADYPECTSLPTKEDQDALWSHLNIIDCFSIGSLPYQLGHDTKQELSPAIGIADAIPLLITAVKDGKLTLEDITSKLRDNPIAIFELHDQPECSIEVNIDRSFKFSPKAVWSPFAGKTLKGTIERVVFKGETTCLDGNPTSEGILGEDMSGDAGSMPLSQRKASLIERKGSVIDRKASLTDPAQFKAARRPSLATSGVSGNMRSTSHVDVMPLGGSSRATMDGQQDDASFSLAPVQIERQISPVLSELIARSPFHRRHILSVNQFTRSDLHLLFTVAQEMRLAVERHGIIDYLKGRLLCTMFFEPSTRTSASFDAAMQRLGGRVVAITANTSSTKKGETLQDTIRTLACYGDAVVLRHPDENSVDIASKFSPVPIINGGMFITTSM